MPIISEPTRRRWVATKEKKRRDLKLCFSSSSIFFLGRQRDEHHHHQPVCEREISPSSLGGSKNISPVRQNSACVAKRNLRSSRIYTLHKKMNAIGRRK